MTHGEIQRRHKNANDVSGGQPAHGLARRVVEMIRGNDAYVGGHIRPTDVGIRIGVNLRPQPRRLACFQNPPRFRVV